MKIQNDGSKMAGDYYNLWSNSFNTRLFNIFEAAIYEVLVEYYN